MMLAALVDNYQDELRADLQRYYGIDLDHAMAGEHSAGHVAALAANLPLDARVYAAQDADATWTRQEILLAETRNAMNRVIYMLADPRKRGKPPEPVGPSWMTRGRTRTLDARVMGIEELMEELNKPRRC